MEIRSIYDYISMAEQATFKNGVAFKFNKDFGGKCI